VTLSQGSTKKTPRQSNHTLMHNVFYAMVLDTRKPNVSKFGLIYKMLANILMIIKDQGLLNSASKMQLIAEQST
jgi:hypothetical protein